MTTCSKNSTHWCETQPPKFKRERLDLQSQIQSWNELSSSWWQNLSCQKKHWKSFNPGKVLIGVSCENFQRQKIFSKISTLSDSDGVFWSNRKVFFVCWHWWFLLLRENQVTCLVNLPYVVSRGKINCPSFSSLGLMDLDEFGPCFQTRREVASGVISSLFLTEKICIRWRENMPPESLWIELEIFRQRKTARRMCFLRHIWLLAFDLDRRRTNTTEIAATSDSCNKNHWKSFCQKTWNFSTWFVFFYCRWNYANS